MNEDEPLHNMSQHNTADWIRLHWEWAHMWCFSERQWWKESNCYNSGGEDSREGVWMHANIHTYSMQAQMHTRSNITATIHRVMENKTKRGVREK